MTMTRLKFTDSQQGELLSLYWPGADNKRQGVRMPRGLKQKVDDLLHYIYEKTGAKFSRNEFIIKAVCFYLRHLIQSKNKKELLKQMEEMVDV